MGKHIYYIPCLFKLLFLTMAAIPLVRLLGQCNLSSAAKITCASLQNSDNVFSIMGTGDRRWRLRKMTGTGTGPTGSAYPSTTLHPTTDKKEIAEMDTNDPRRFSQIRALPSQNYVACFQDPLVEKFISKMLNKKGMRMRSKRVPCRKVVTRDIMYNAMEMIKHTQLEKYYQAASESERQDIETNPYTIIHGAFENLSEHQRSVLSLKWLIEASRIQGWFEDEYTSQRLAQELVAAFYNTGKVVRKKQEMHKEAESNKAYAHFRWGR